MHLEIKLYFCQSKQTDNDWLQWMTSLSAWAHSDIARQTGVDFTHRRRYKNKTFLCSHDLEVKERIGCSMEIYEAKYDYCEDCGESLLSFSKGDKFLITYKSEGGWWAAQNLSSNEIGYVPSSFVEVKQITFCFLILSISIPLLEMLVLLLLRNPGLFAE